LKVAIKKKERERKKERKKKKAEVNLMATTFTGTRLTVA
jgi:hypothetical protein